MTLGICDCKRCTPSAIVNDKMERLVPPPAPKLVPIDKKTGFDQKENDLIAMRELLCDLLMKQNKS